MTGVGRTGRLRFGFGTNGFANHRLPDALDVIAGLGYDGVALTLDHGHLDPFADDLAGTLRQVARRLDRLGLAVMIETGARYLLDPWHKHEPTLVSADGREVRVDFLCRAVRIAAELGAEAVSFWSGVAPAGLSDEDGWRRLTEGCVPVCQEADRLGVRLGFEPEPGMFVDTLDRLAELRRRLARLADPDLLGTTVDIGHCRCLEPDTVPGCLYRAGPLLANVQIDDMRRGVHEHLEFGAGEIDFGPVLSALREVRYRGLVSVELPRHSHAAVAVARRSLEFLRAVEEAAT